MLGLWPKELHIYENVQAVGLTEGLCLERKNSWDSVCQAENVDSFDSKAIGRKGKECVCWGNGELELVVDFDLFVCEGEQVVLDHSCGCTFELSSPAVSKGLAKHF